MTIAVRILGTCILWLVVVTSIALATDERAEIRAALDQADSLSRIGDNAAALDAGLAALASAQSSLDAGDTLIARAHLRTAVYFFRTRNIDSAEYHTRQALAGFTASLGDSASADADALNFLGVVQKTRENVARAATSYERAMKIYRHLGEDSSAAAARCMHNLATCYDDMGRLQQALELHNTARRLLKMHLGDDHPAVGSSLANTGQVYFKLGQSGLSEKYIRDAIAIMEKRGGPHTMQLAGVLGNLGYVLQTRGRYAEAASVLARALKIVEANPRGGAASRSLFTQYAGLLRRNGQADSALVVFRRAYDVAGEIGGERSMLAIQAEADLALATSEVGRYAEADSLWSDVEDYFRSEGMETSREMLVIQYNRLRSVNRRPGSDVQPAMDRVEQLVESLYANVDHPVKAYALAIVAEAALTRGDVSRALAAAREALRIRMSLVIDDARYLNERDALTTARDLVHARDLTIAAIIAAPGAVEITDDLADDLFAVKGLITEVIAARQQAAATATTHEDEATAQLVSVRRDIAQAFVSPQAWSNPAYESTVAALQQRADSLERETAGRTAATLPKANRSLDHLREHVHNTGDVVVDYLVINYPTLAEGASIRRYVAAVWQDCDAVTIIPLASADSVNAAVDALRTHLLAATAEPGLPSAEREAEYRQIAGRLSDQIWEPIAERLCAEPGTIIVSADGALAMVPFAALPAGEHGYLADNYEMHYISAPRDSFDRVARPIHGSLLAMGDPDYDLSEADTTVSIAALRSSVTDCQFADIAEIGELPLSRYEVETIAREWSNSHNDAATVLLADDATEAGFRDHAAGHAVIHLATHGYHLPPGCFGASNNDSTALDDDVVYHPLLLSGLFLAGAANANRDGSASNDGILSAYEITGLDLAGTRAVVLSACETGLGKSVASEGVYGLRRAFRLAGARTVICSLWPVPDRRTAKLMSRLYQKDSGDLAGRLCRLQREELERLRSAGASTHPVSWAAFISIE